MTNRRLALLTAAYPFGRRSETFLDAELPVLADRFDEIIVLPSRREEHVRPLPPGVRYETVLADLALGSARREALRQPPVLASQFLRALFQEGRPWAYLGHPRTYLHVAAHNLVKYRALGAFIEAASLREVLFYDYWLENSTLALAWLRREGRIKRAVARAHRFDLYDECWQAGAVPFRTFKIAALDAVFVISAHGLEYLRHKAPTVQGKLRLSRLGVELPAKLAPAHRRESDPLVVSCASLLPFKRVHLVPEILSRLGRPVRWVHFGDGPERPGVERSASRLPPHVRWHLAGHLDHSDVLSFYRANKVDLFLSMSASEGLPVSMMEAISFGIPILATAVGGVPEVANCHTGALVRIDDPPQRIAAAAQRLLDGVGPPAHKIRSFCEAHFSASRNFADFADMLHAVQETEGETPTPLASAER